MVTTILNFGFVILSAYLVGIEFIEIFRFKGEECTFSWDEILVCGVLALMVYAEFFSIFTGVGLIANLLLVFYDLLAIIKNRYLIKKHYIALRNNSKYIFIVCVMSVIYFAMLAIQTPNHADTGLYHAQSIRWIEEFGVVKGLGNLHHRFAYNSAFLCLQALFSWKFLLGQSLHGINSLWSMIMFIYFIVSISNSSESYSRALKMVIPIYIFFDRYRESSPNTDSFVMLLVVYIFIKWFDNIENNNKTRWLMLAFFAVCGCTAKLSIAPIVLVTINLVIILSDLKRLRIIHRIIFILMLAVIPYIIRNAIISGYLLYPYPSIDVLNVDWKMNSYMVQMDKSEIVAWGRSIYDLEASNVSFGKWFPKWFDKLDFLYKALFVVNILCTLSLIVFYFIKKKWNYLFYSCTVASCILFWIITAPQVRFGIVYMFIGVTTFIDEICKSKKEKIYTNEKLVMAIVGLLLIFGLTEFKDFRKVFPNDYMPLDMCEVNWNDIIVYVPVKDAQEAFYTHFPETPYAEILECIELRGDDISDGFKIKDEYKALKITTSGEIIYVN